MNILCSKCGNQSEGLNGEFAAYVLFVLTIPLIFLLGISMISIAGLGLYTFIVHHSSKHICKDCTITACPECNEKIEKKNLCIKCKNIICPYCNSNQRKLPIPGHLVLLYCVLFPVMLLVILGLGFFNLLWMILFAIIVLYFSSPKCNTCGKRIHMEYF